MVLYGHAISAFETAPYMSNVSKIYLKRSPMKLQYPPPRCFSYEIAIPPKTLPVYNMTNPDIIPTVMPFTELPLHVNTEPQISPEQEHCFLEFTR